MLKYSDTLTLSQPDATISVDNNSYCNLLLITSFMKWVRDPLCNIPVKSMRPITDWHLPNRNDVTLKGQKSVGRCGVSLVVKLRYESYCIITNLDCELSHLIGGWNYVCYLTSNHCSSAGMYLYEFLTHLFEGVCPCLVMLTHVGYYHLVTAIGCKDENNDQKTIS